jgi:hypothetical protein
MPALPPKADIHNGEAPDHVRGSAARGTESTDEFSD